MKNGFLATAAVLATLALPTFAYAQSGATTGMVGGAVGGAVVAGPIGAVVGAVGGAVIGGIADRHRTRFHTYAAAQRHASYQYGSEVVVGAELPASGVTYYDVPSEYGVHDYRYTVVNNRTVLVDQQTHRIVQIID